MYQNDSILLKLEEKEEETPIVKNIEELVGRTPLFEFEKFEEKHDIKAHLLGKLEYFNPSGSIKDRAALNMIKKAEEAEAVSKEAGKK